jgi:putative tributyrin esterase
VTVVNVSVSSPVWSPRGFTSLAVHSTHLRGRGDVLVYVPAAAQGCRAVPAVILLHGLRSSSWTWAFTCGAHVAAEQSIAQHSLQPFALVMPSDGLDGEGSAYATLHGSTVESWITDDVIDVARTTIPELTETDRWFVAGFSMGGFGALRLAARHPQLFRAVAAHAPLASLADFETCLRTDPVEFRDQFVDVEELDLTGQLGGLKRMSLIGGRPAVRIDCGASDELVSASRRLRRELTRLGIAHEYEEPVGGHDAAYCHARLVDTARLIDRSCRDS